MPSRSMRSRTRASQSATSSSSRSVVYGDSGGRRAPSRLARAGRAGRRETRARSALPAARPSPTDHRSRPGSGCADRSGARAHQGVPRASRRARVPVPDGARAGASPVRRISVEQPRELVQLLCERVLHGRVDLVHGSRDRAARGPPRSAYASTPCRHRGSTRASRARRGEGPRLQSSTGRRRGRHSG